MRVSRLVLWALPALTSIVGAAATTKSTAGVEAFVKRRLPQHSDQFEFRLLPDSTTSKHGNTSETYTVSSSKEGRLVVEGNTVSALVSGLHRYLADEAHVDIWWFVGSELDKAPASLPHLHAPLHGSSVVPWRYHLNTVTTSYTSPFWSWEDWETQLDWMALRGINIALAWVGVEKIFLDVFRDIGLHDAEIYSFLSGPAFLAWNHFGNIQGSWGGDLPESWINSQFALQKKILARMEELGMTPILPAFPGFVPENITSLWPDASVAKSPQWNGFAPRYTNDTYLTPYDPHFAQLQRMFIQKQQELYGNVTKFWTLDQFNENRPASGDLGYLGNVSRNTWQTLKDADPDAVWVMQGWLFASDSAFWSVDRVKAFLDGVPVDEDMLILDLFSESTPQWQRTDSFYGKPWIWCQLHDYGGNMGLYGQVENVTRNAIEAVQQSGSLVGFGLTMEGQEGNEIMYDLLLDQAWSVQAIDTAKYFRSWVSTRYGGVATAWGHGLPKDLYSAWDMVRSTVYNNTDSSVTAVTKSILTLLPAITGLTNRTGHHPTKLTYDPKVLVQAWSKLYRAGLQDPLLFLSPTYQYDLTDWTRQVLANAFQAVYEQLVSSYSSGKSIKHLGQQLQAILSAQDEVLATNENFLLSKWIGSARQSAQDAGFNDGFFEYNARDQITLWGPTGEIEDYASKEWAGLVKGYYARRWDMFVQYLQDTPVASYDQAAFKAELQKWERGWVNGTQADQHRYGEVKVSGALEDVISRAVKTMPDILAV